LSNAGVKCYFTTFGRSAGQKFVPFVTKYDRAFMPKRRPLVMSRVSHNWYQRQNRLFGAI
jgi:hypothetical protein